MNFLRRAGAILMVVAIFASSCNKYSDDFAQLNTKMDALATQVASITQVSTDVAALKAQITALQTAVAALPNPTASIATLTTNLAALSTKVDGLVTTVAAVKTTGETSATVIAGLKTDLAALAKTVADNNTAMNTKLAALAATDVTQSASLQALVDANVVLLAKIAANQTSLDGITTKMGTVQTSLDALTAADKLLATQVSVDALNTLIAAQKVQLDLIIANTALKVLDAAITGNVLVGGILTAAPGVLTSSSATVTYQWSNCATSGGTYADIAGATSKTYTVVAGDLTKFIKVKLTGTGSYLGSNATSPATAAVGAQTAMTAVTIAGTAQVGAKLTATVTPVVATPGATATFQWQSAATATGVYTDIAGATKSTYTSVAADATRFIRVVVTGTEGYFGVVTSNVIGAIAFLDVTTPAFTLTPTMNTITVTLTDGTFTAGVAKGNFTMVGLDAALATWTGATFTRVSDTQVKFQTAVVGGFGGTSANTITIANAGMATQATAATAAGSIDVIIVPVGAAVAGIAAPVAGAVAAVTATTTGGTASVSWSPALATGGKFAPGIAYTATVTVTASAGYNLTVPVNYFTVAGATATNPVNSGVVTAVFAATPTVPVTIAAILGVTPPVAGATAATVITGNAEYTGTITWFPAPIAGKFQSVVPYTATINIVPNLGYSVSTLGANFFTVAGSAPAATNPAASGVVTAAFPATL